MILIAILFVFGMITLILYKDKQDVSFNAKDASNMVSPKTLKKNKERLDKLLEEENKEDERHYKMLKKCLMKKYLICWYFLDQGMEGIPSLTDSFIVEAKDAKDAIHKFPSKLRHEYKGYGHVCVLGEIVNNNVLVEKEHYAYRNLVEWQFKEAKVL